MDLVQPMQTDNDISLGQTIRTYGRQLFGFIKSKTKSLEDAEDILQEVWYQLSRLTNLDELENVSAWLYAVSRNKITDLYRKKKNEHLEDYSYTDEEGITEIKELLLLDDRNNPELKLFKDLFWKVFQQALNELPENQRQVFVDNELNDKTLNLIAKESGENLKTIISRKGYAVKHLRNRLLPLYRELSEK